MSPKTRIILSEKNIYVSWGILVLAIGITYMVAQTMTKVDELSNVIPEVKNLNERVTKLETAMTWVTEMYSRDIKPPNK